MNTLKLAPRSSLILNQTLHFKAIFGECEMSEAATCKDFLQVRLEGGRDVSRKLLEHAGKVSAESAKAKAELEYARYRTLLDAQPQRIDAEFEKAAKELKKLPKPKKP